MKAIDLIAVLERLIEQHGDCPVAIKGHLVEDYDTGEKTRLRSELTTKAIEFNEKENIIFLGWGD